MVRARHPRWFAEEHLEREVDGFIRKMRILEDELRRGRRCAHHGEGATLAFADIFKKRELRGGNREDVAFLRLIAPDLEGRHARLVVRDGPQLEATAAAGIIH